MNMATAILPSSTIFGTDFWVLTEILRGMMPRIPHQMAGSDGQAKWSSAHSSALSDLGRNENARNRISIRYYAAPLTSFWFLGSNSPRLSSVESTWEVESQIYGDEFWIGMRSVHCLFQLCPVVAWITRSINGLPSPDRNERGMGPIGLRHRTKRDL
jgi:hypothetical protein